MTSMRTKDMHPSDGTGGPGSPAPEYALVQRLMELGFLHHDHQEMLKVCARELLKLYGGQVVALWVREEQQQGALVIASVRPLTPAALEEIEQVVASAREKFISVDLPLLNRTLSKEALNETGEPFHSAVPRHVHPLAAGGECPGVLLLDEPAEDALDPGRSARLKFLTSQLAINLIAVRHVRELLITDPLTGCFNRWFMDVELSRRLEADPEQMSRTFAVLLLDVDHFKSINDGYGHGAGDGCLVQLAGILRSHLDESDEVIRMGGDEFLLFLPGDRSRDYPALAGDILTAVRKTLRLEAAPERTVTLSMGLLVHEADTVLPSKEELLERVDKALYASKRSGRDRVTLWFPELPAGEEESAADSPPGMPVRELRKKAERLEAELHTHRDQLVETLSLILSTKEFETGLHSLRVARMTELLVDKLDVTDALKRQIVRGARLHDIGKLAIPEAILHKEGDLTESEWTIMRHHPQIGHRFVAGYPFLEEAAEIILHHHEAYDGSGYPCGLKGEAIPLGARLFALIDAYDSMRANRVYKPSVSREDAVRELSSKAGSQFDPRLVDTFLSCIDEIEALGNWN